MILAVTGHRPDKLLGYGKAARDALEAFAITELQRLKPSQVITGMALGWDTAIAEAAAKLSIPFIAAVPFVGQERTWPAEAKAQYRGLLREAKEVHVVCPGGYSASKMQMRNEWMVGRCAKLLALWNGSPGGTSNCIAYAESLRCSVENCWDRFQSRCESAGS